MRPLFIGQLLPFTAKPFRASRLKNINLRNFTTFIIPLLHPRGRLKNFVSRSSLLFGHTTGPRQLVSPPYFHVRLKSCDLTLKEVFTLFYFIFAQAYLHRYYGTAKRSSLPCRPPCQPFLDCVTPRKRGILHQANNPR